MTDEIPSDVGTEESSDNPPLDIGDYVVDVDDDSDSPDLARVINQPGVVARAWDAYLTEDGEQLTVADTNPEHPADETVIVCLFASQLKEYYPNWGGSNPLNLAELTEQGVTNYAFPRSRLKKVDPMEIATPPSEFDELIDEFGSGAEMQVEFVEGEHRLNIEKLGIEYTVTEDGVVVGDGPHRDSFVEAVDSLF